MWSKATDWEFTGICFNGRDTQLVYPVNPLAGAEAFTIEAVFLPEAGGEPEQRFVHVQGDDESRALLELRSTENGWYGDVFVHFHTGERFLNNPDLLHPFGQWVSMALVYDGSRLQQYINGRLELEGDAPAGLLGVGRTSIGMRLNRISPFKGMIGKVRFTPSVVEEGDLIRPSI